MSSLDIRLPSLFGPVCAASRGHWCRFAGTAYLSIFLLLASASALSLNCPCGPSGLWFTSITSTLVLPSDLVGETSASNPLLRNSSLKALAALMPPSDECISTPVGSSGPVCGTKRRLFGNTRCSISPGGCTVHCATESAESISTVKALASISPCSNCEKVVVPGNFRKCAPMALWSAVDRVLHATLASILTRSICSSSASLRNCSSARSSEDASRCNEAMVSRDLVSCLYSKMNVCPSKITSPAMPTTTNSGPKEWRAIFLSAQRSKGVDLKKISFPSRSISSLSFAQYSSDSADAQNKCGYYGSPLDCC